MTQDYVNGFFTKCAEHRVPYDLAVVMYKRAAGDSMFDVVPKMRRAAAAANMGSLAGNALRMALPGPGFKATAVKNVAGILGNKAKSIAARKKATVPAKAGPGSVPVTTPSSTAPAAKAAPVEKTPVPAPTK